MSERRTGQGSTIFYSYKKKTQLERARFTQTFKPSEARPTYRITSDFSTKSFSKGPLFKPTPWIHGINMVTFVMCSGVYPTDVMIRKRIAALRNAHLEHNDLVIGNIIMQGDKLIPIDFNDTRRSGNSVSCIAAALQAFHEGNRRLKDPTRWINDYYKSV